MISDRSIDCNGDILSYENVAFEEKDADARHTFKHFGNCICNELHSMS